MKAAAFPVFSLDRLLQSHWAMLGAGREGLSLIRWVKQCEPDRPLWVFCEQAPEWPPGLPWDEQRDHLIIGPLEHAVLSSFDVLVKSPGISLYHPALAALSELTPITSCTNLWFAQFPQQRVLAITGTKGKSTTSALTAHLLRSAGMRVALVGNIGVPVIERLSCQVDWWVMELSSYQCADLQARPEVGVVLSLFPEHLDWHGGEQRYLQDKLRLLRLARQAWAPLSLRLQLAQHMAVPADALERIHWLQQDKMLQPSTLGLTLDGQVLLAAQELPLPGLHNIHNICVAWELARYAGVSDAQIRSGLASFRGLPHRLEQLGDFSGHRFINDSISTTPHAAVAALQACAEQVVTILVGGYDRGLSWQVFIDYLRQHPCHALVAMGVQGRQVEHLLKEQQVNLCGGIHWAPDLPVAVRLARNCTPVGGRILLSPGAPSYGEFKNFEARGASFITLASATS